MSALIAVDMDQVLCDWIAKILEMYNASTPWCTAHPVLQEHIDMWNLERTLGPNAIGFMNNCMKDIDFWTSLRPIDGALLGMRQLHDIGYDLVIATTIVKEAPISYWGKLRWIEKNLPWFNLNSFIAIKRKELLTADYLIDDAEHNIVPWENSGRIGLLFDAPYNQNTKCNIRVAGWNDITEYFKNIKG